MSDLTQSPMPRFPSRRAFRRETREQKQCDALTADLQASLAREKSLLGEKSDLSQRHAMLAQEFDHRLVNGLQLIVSLLTIQSRTATTAEASAQLTIAARRVAALGRVHHRLHLLDHQDRVNFKEYLQHLCEDLSNLLCEDQLGCTVVVEGEEVEISTAFAIPLGFVVNELITNAVKYAKGRIAVRIEGGPSTAVSVVDDGPGLPAGFDPTQSKGLGMKIVLSLVKQIGGELQFSSGDNGRGTRASVVFCSPVPTIRGV
jgi:two-component system, sensor histidine kinase PdtaS